MSVDSGNRLHGVEPAWHWLAGGLALHALLLIVFRDRFDYERELAEIPALWLAGGLVSAGLVYLAAVARVRTAIGSAAVGAPELVRYFVVVGLALRVAMLWSTPALEDDFHRYLWDGGVAVQGYNPYRYRPDAMTEPSTPQPLRELADSAGYIHGRINHPDLRTIYPPVAIAAFAIAYLAEAWSLLAWRLVCLACEGVSVWLLLTLLRETGRSPLWMLIYWWNPLVIKEVLNSAHMEAVLVPLLLAAMLQAVRRRHTSATVLVGLAAATKIWPALLLPLFLRPLWGDRARLAGALAVLAALAVAAAWLPMAAGFDKTSGFVAYAAQWRNGSALFPALEGLWHGVLWLAGAAEGEMPGRLARAVMAGTAAMVALALALRPVPDAEHIIARASLIAAAVLLLSPAQFPWYLTWVMPFLALRPIGGLIVATVLMPLYYVSFHLAAKDQAWIFSDVIVWVIWLPVWALLAHEFISERAATGRASG